MVRRQATLFAALAGAIAQAAASEGGGGGQALITPQFGLIFWTLVTFVALVLFLRWFAWKPLLGAIEARERAIQESQDQARRDREEAARLAAEQRSMLEDARRERLEALDQGRKDAERLKAEILGEAKLQRERALRQAEAQVETLLRQAKAELRAQTADLAVQVASKLIGRNLEGATQQELVEEYLADLERSGGPPPKPPS